MWPQPAGEKKTFTLFPNLSAELQLNIWLHTIPGPRVIEIMHQEDALKQRAGVIRGLNERSHCVLEMESPLERWKPTAILELLH
jgi:hypothetical protein